ncbi:MAG: PAC2 family protein [Dehalococcoidales bacterium]|nr:PAC2 family protein [Dehalococcoidales bacterium]
MSSSVIRITARPKLRTPNLLAAWPGIGNVAMILAAYLRAKLPFKDLGYIDPAYFFDPVGVLVKDNVIQAPTFPQNNFYYWKNDSGENDLILFMGEDQPMSKSYDLAHCILDVAERFGVNRIYTCAAAITRIHHSEMPKVWGVATSRPVAEELARHNLQHADNLQIAGLNGLLLGVAKERAIEGICLLGEVPVYASRVPNPMAALAVLKVLTTVLGIQVDLAELARMAVEAKERIKQVAAQAMEEYIDYFTEPIWERDVGEENEEEDDDEGGEEVN